MMLFSRSSAPLCRRLVSQHQQASSPRRRLSSLTIPFNPATSTKSQIASLITDALTASPPPAHHNAAVLLASPSLAPWLQDEAFLASLLTPLRPTSNLSLLAAAVDAIPHLTPAGTYTTTPGLSLLHGPRATLWTFPPTPTPDQQAASLEFHLPPLPSDPLARPLRVTLPAALTVFANGRPHTVLTSRWDTSSSTTSPHRLVDVAATSHAVIRPGPAASSRIVLPLVPLTPARRVVAGLGNILRQVEVDGRATPASKELEEAIPRLLAGRGGERRVVGVWAVVYPARAGPAAASGDVEGVLARGGHVRKVLSGGGGWGAKQGLLSLDPQTRYAAAGEEDVESFIRSFHGEEAGGGVVAPGSWVQFMVEEVEVGGTDGLRPSMILGTHVAVESDGSSADAGTKVEVLENIFGASSSQGIYVATEAVGQAGDGEIVTKIDAARSYVGSISGPVE
ncbi:hypothetical protein B0T18DRAFT_488772 [Schizothecium vesticola]|uniref:Uncharacterized protein n=1 Tax=Schizothecium vesticola TaxID=314040 RepID=A0AA40EV81_9PEZI|nr:hypothetical protein B0T18DRAFT_488772 [Schizothecium vesticola]